MALPRERLLFRGTSGAGAEVIVEGGDPEPAVASADGNGIIVSHNAPAHVRAALEAEGFEVVPGCGGAVAVAPLLPGVRAGLRFVSPESEAGLSVRGRVGLMIAREAGASIQGDRGEVFPDDLDTAHWTVSLAADPGDQQLLREIMKREA